MHLNLGVRPWSRRLREWVVVALVDAQKTVIAGLGVLVVAVAVDAVVQLSKMEPATAELGSLGMQSDMFVAEAGNCSDSQDAEAVRNVLVVAAEVQCCSCVAAGDQMPLERHKTLAGSACQRMRHVDAGSKASRRAVVEYASGSEAPKLGEGNKA